MFFASPLWLFALLPWSAGVLWLLWGTRKKTPVPFLELWRGPELHKPAKRALQPPPIFLAMTILGILLATLAAGRPKIVSRHAAPGSLVTIVVDRGLSMSAAAGGDRRYIVAGKRAEEAIRLVLAGTTPVDLIVLPDAEAKATNIADWLGDITSLSPTAVDTQAILEQTVRERLQKTAGVVIVISDRRLPFDDPRLIEFSPDVPIDNVGIVEFAARETPSLSQAMVRLRNDSNRQSVGITVISGSQKIQKTVNLPSPGGEQNYFIDLPHFEEVIEAALDVKDDQSADDSAWLVRGGTFPKIEPRAPLSRQLERMIAIYARTRPPMESSQKIAVVATEAELPGNTPAVCLVRATGPSLSGAIVAASHPVTANVNWQVFPTDALTAGDAPRGWSPMVTFGGKVIVAARAEPTRQIWVGFDSPTWSATPDFVVFWANVFTWLGQSQLRFAAHSLSEYDPVWKPAEPTNHEPGLWPGIYRTDEGTLRAFNAAPAISDIAKTTPNWRERLARAEGAGNAGYNLSPAILILGLLFLTVGAGTWRRPIAQIGSGVVKSQQGNLAQDLVARSRRPM